jgi:capsular exopolysaccharide synthesis family protein
MRDPDVVYIDLRKIYQRIKNNWYVFFLALAVCFLVAFIYNYTVPKVYLFKSSMLIGKNQTGSRLAAELLTAMGAKSDYSKNLKDEKKILTSFNMIKKACEQIDLRISYFTGAGFAKVEWFGDAAFPFKVLIDSGGVQPLHIPIYFEVNPNGESVRFKINEKNVHLYDYTTEKYVARAVELKLEGEVGFGEKFTSESFSFRIIPNNVHVPGHAISDFFIVFNDIDKVVEDYMKKLEVNELDRDSYIMELVTKGSIPEKEKALMNMLMRVYIKSDEEMKQRQAQEALGYIYEQLDIARNALASSEGNLQKFKSTRQQTAVQSSANEVGTELQNLTRRRMEVNTKLDRGERLKAFFDSNAETYEQMAPIALSLGEPQLEESYRRLQMLAQEKTTLSYGAGAANPRIRVLENQIVGAREALKQQLRTIIQSAVLALNDLDRDIKKLESQFQVIPYQEKQIAALTRASEYDENMYQNLLQKKTEAEILLATSTSDISIIENARMIGDKPVSPRPLLSYLVALLIGTVFSYLVISVNDYLDDRIKNKEALLESTEVPFIGIILKGEKDSKVVFDQSAKSGVAESFRSLRINIEYLKRQREQCHVIGITSSASGEGKTFCSVNLAYAFAQSGKKTALICADLRKPRLHEYLPLRQEGLAGCLLGHHELDEILQPTKDPHLFVINAGSRPGDPSPTVLLDNPRLSSLMAFLSEQFQVLIIDTPPVGFVAEYHLLKKYMHTTLYIARANVTTKSVLRELNDLYRSGKVQNLHVVLNDLKLSEAIYGYKENQVKAYL